MTKAPEELGLIIRRAMDASPEARFETAAQLGLAVDDYLRHRGSRRLEERARDSLVQLEKAIARRDPENKDHDTLYGLYRECRFGFREALSTWPDNEMAREGSRCAARMMSELELSRGDGEAAERLLAELGAPDPALPARVAEARRQAGAERARLEAMDADLDIRTGQRTRAIVAGVLGLVWTLMPLAKRHQAPETIYGWTGIASAIGLMVLALGFGYWARESLSRTLPNRRILAVLIFTFVANALLGMGCFMLEVPPLRYHALLLFEWFAIASVLTLTVDKRLWPSAVAFALTFVLAARDPAHVRYVMSAANFVLTLNAVYIWRPVGGYFAKQRG
jgi:serine/threonine-protein kinase